MEQNNLIEFPLYSDLYSAVIVSGQNRYI